MVEGRLTRSNMMISRRAGLKLAASSLLLLSDRTAFGKPPDFWNHEAPADWTGQEIQQLTSDSPWAKSVTAIVNMSSPAAGMGGSGGRRGGGGRAGRGSTDAAPAASSPKFPGYVRWISAAPMLLALKMKLPADLEGHYVIGVSGLPIISGHSEGEDNSDSYDALKEATFLQVKGQPSVQPGIVEQDPNDTSTVLFGFLHQFLDVSDAKVAEFKMTTGPFEIKAKFDLKQMRYHGELAV